MSSLSLAAMNFVIFNYLSSKSPKNFMVSEPFTTSSTLISGKSCFLVVYLVLDVIKSAFPMLILS